VSKAAKLAAIFVESLPTPAYSFSRTLTLTFHGIKPVVTPSIPAFPAARAVCKAEIANAELFGL
jgi:hypothetical protein